MENQDDISGSQNPYDSFDVSPQEMRLAQLELVLEIIDISEEGKSVLTDTLKIRSLLELTLVTDEVFAEFRSTNVAFAYPDIPLLKLAQKWYQEHARSCTRETIPLDLDLWQLYVLNQNALRAQAVNTQADRHDTPRSFRSKEESVEPLRKGRFLSKPDINAYPKFDGKLENFTKFKRMFTSVATAQGFDRIIVKGAVPPGDFSGDEDWEPMSSFVFSAANYALGNGQAAYRSAMLRPRTAIVLGKPLCRFTKGRGL
jgi:hypothetical protein